jgi:dGTPase
MANQARDTVRHLYGYFMDHENELPPEYVVSDGNKLEQKVVDYIAGMTDQYALKVAAETGSPY